jgi:hypothetical protein
LIYPDELGIKDTTESKKCFISGYFDFDSNGTLTITVYDKRDDFAFVIVNFPFLCNNIPLSPAYFAYEDFSKRGKLLTKK